MGKVQKVPAFWRKMHLFSFVVVTFLVIKNFFFSVSKYHVLK